MCEAPDQPDERDERDARDARGDASDDLGAPGDASDEPIELPIDGSLDLHMFRPRDVASVVSEYLDACRERGILSVRIAHGKGIGTQREIVHALLARRADVTSYRLDSQSASGWGATLVELRPPDGAKGTPD